MRAHEIMETISQPVEHMMLKMRKGGAAALNAKLLTEIIANLDGWKIENTKILKPSDGGWVLGATPFGEMIKKMYGNHGGKTYKATNELQFYAEYDTAPDPQRDSDWNDRSKVAYAQMKDQVFPLMQANLSKKGRYEIKNLRISENKRGNYQRVEIDFDFFVWCSAYIVTSSDGGTYEICGDYKNGAVNPTDFQTFFKWAATETDFMDQILAILGMEAHEKKHDPKKRWSPPPASSKETVKVFELLKDMTNDIREQQKGNLIEWMNSQVNRFIDALTNEPARAKEIAKTNALIAMLWDYKAKGLVADWEAKIEPIAEEQVEAMQNEFIYKNTGKLAPIMTAKKTEFHEKIINISTHHGSITANLEFSFADGSSFRVTQSIEQSYVHTFRMSQPTYFYRFPTRFHDVKLADGTKVFPSEENMHAVFAKG